MPDLLDSLLETVPKSGRPPLSGGDELDALLAQAPPARTSAATIPGMERLGALPGVSPQILAEEPPAPLAQQFGVSRLPIIGTTRQPAQIAEEPLGYGDLWADAIKRAGKGEIRPVLSAAFTSPLDMQKLDRELGSFLIGPFAIQRGIIEAGAQIATTPGTYAVGAAVSRAAKLPQAIRSAMATGKTPASVAKALGATSIEAADAAVSAYFAGNMASGLYEAGKTAVEAAQAGDWDTAARSLGFGSAEGVFAFLSGRNAYLKGKSVVQGLNEAATIGRVRSSMQAELNRRERERQATERSAQQAAIPLLTGPGEVVPVERAQSPAPGPEAPAGPVIAKGGVYDFRFGKYTVNTVTKNRVSFMREDPTGKKVSGTMPLDAFRDMVAAAGAQKAPEVSPVSVEPVAPAPAPPVEPVAEAPPAGWQVTPEEFLTSGVPPISAERPIPEEPAPAEVSTEVKGPYGDSGSFPAMMNRVYGAYEALKTGKPLSPEQSEAVGVYMGKANPTLAELKEGIDYTVGVTSDAIGPEATSGLHKLYAGGREVSGTEFDAMGNLAGTKLTTSPAEVPPAAPEVRAEPAVEPRGVSEAVPDKPATPVSEWGIGGKGGRIYSATYGSADFGTERLVTVTDNTTGRIIGQRDPFYPSGIPTSKAARQQRIKQVAREIADEYDAKAVTAPAAPEVRGEPVVAPREGAAPVPGKPAAPAPAAAPKQPWEMTSGDYGKAPLVRTVGEDISSDFLHGTSRKNIGSLTAPERPHGSVKPRNANPIFEAIAPAEQNEFGAELLLSEPRQPQQAHIFSQGRGSGLAVVRVKSGTKVLDLSDEASRSPRITLENEPSVIRFFRRPSFTDDLIEWKLGKISEGYKERNPNWREDTKRYMDPGSPEFDPYTWRESLVRYAKDRGYGLIRFADETLVTDRSVLESAREATAKERQAASTTRTYPGSRLASLFTDKQTGAVKEAHRYAVERALREGKPVPPEVLAEYPDLKPPAPATPARVETDVLDEVVAAAPKVQVEPQKNLIERIYKAITSTKEDVRLGLEKIAEETYGGTRAEGKFTKRDVYEAQEAAVNRWLRENGKRLLTAEPEAALSEIRVIEDKLATQSVRSQEQIDKQQFSTPPTIAYLIDRIAAPRAEDVVLEPSAGTGGLVSLLADTVKEVHVNEIDPQRAALAKHVLGVEATQHDAEIINSLLDPSVKPTLIVMNPPFTAGAVDKPGAAKGIRYGFNHLNSALQRLRENGRLVMIHTGGREGFQASEGASFASPTARPFWQRIVSRYNVRANVRLSGKEYGKYGTTMPVQIIVIDKTGRTPGSSYKEQVESATTGEYNTIEEAYNALRSVSESRPGVQPVGNVVPVSPGAVSGRVPATVQEIPAGARKRPGRTEPAPEPRQPRAEAGPSPIVPERKPELAVVEPEATGGVARKETSRSGVQDAGRPPLAKSTEEPAADVGAFVHYQPTIEGKPHPGVVVETRTMATTPMPPLTYKAKLPPETEISGVQLEAVTVAGQQNDIVLTDGSRGAALIGDGTGVGKGRIAAAILWDNWNRGRRRQVWVSESWKLMEDAKRDLNGIKSPLAPKVTAFQKLDSARPIPIGEGIIFTTYATLRSVDKKGNKRAEQLRAWLEGGNNYEGGYIVFDESHNLKNAVPMGREQPSQIGQTVKKLLTDAKNLRTVSLSATAASEVQNLGYLDRLGLWGPGTPFPNGFVQFAQQIAGGGVSAMEMVARELKATGKYVSRTLAFRGDNGETVTYRDSVHPINEDQEAIYAAAAEGWQTVNEFVDTAIETINGGRQARAAFMNQYYGAQQRFFGLLLTALKAPTAIAEARQTLAEGKAAVITLVNTSEAAQNRAKAQSALSEDEEESDNLDFGPKEILINLIREHFPVQQWADTVDANGNPTKVAVMRPGPDGTQIPVNNPDAERQRDELIEKLDRELRIPANPLDIIIEALGGPKQVAELTGRKERFNPVTQKFEKRGTGNTDKVNLTEMHAFQEGKKLVALLSNAAGTGISLHSDRGAVNKRKRVHITLQPGWSADKAMQMLGRTHRTNQEHPPEYVFVVSDLGGEKRFISTIAKRLSSLGALTKGERSASGGTEAMSKVNFESDQGTEAAYNFYTSLLRGEVPPGSELGGMDILEKIHVLKTDPRTGAKTVLERERYNVRRLLNRVLALEPKLQNAVYDYYFDIFERTIEKAILEGKLDTGVKEIAGDEVKISERRELSSDPKTGAKTYYYKVTHTEKMKRVSAEDLEDRIKKFKPKEGQPEPRIMRNRRTGQLAYATPAQPITHATGRVEEAFNVIRPEDSHRRKIGVDSFHAAETVEEYLKDAVGVLRGDISGAESDKKHYADYDYPWAKSYVEKAEQVLAEKRPELERLEKASKDPQAWALEEWQRLYEEAPEHRTVEQHLVGGAVLRWWNAVRESAGRLQIFSAQDTTTRDRIVGVEIPADSIQGLIQRVSGGRSTVNERQMYDDVLRNATRYDLEGGMQVVRGRIARNSVVQIIPPDVQTGRRLQALGVEYERGIMPVYYIPTDPKKSYSILRKVLDEFPPTGTEAAEVAEIPAQEQARGERGAAPILVDLATWIRDRFQEEGPKANYSGIGSFKDRFLRNLSQLEKASPAAHTAAVRAASSRAQSATILRAAVPSITKALEGSDYSWEELRLALVESRLRGIKERWENFADQAETAEDDQLKRAFTEQFSGLLDVIEGKRGIPQDVSHTAAALFEAEDWGTLAEFLAQTFRDAANNVAVAMEPAWFNAVTEDAKVQDALRIYKDLVERPMAENHALNEGVFSDSLGPLDTYYPLISLERSTPSGPGRRLPYHKPRNIANKFATGLSEGYDTAMEAFRDRLAAAVRSNDKAALLNALEDEGWLTPLGRGEDAGTFVAPDGTEYKGAKIERSPQRLIIKDKKVIPTAASFAVIPEWLERELRPILDRERPLSTGVMDRVISAVNWISLAGPADFVFHVSNLMGTVIANTPFLGTSLVDKGLSAPIIKKFAGIAKILQTDPTTPEAAADLIRMAKLGLVPSRYGSETYSKRLADELGSEKKPPFVMGPLLYGPHGIDIRARLFMYRLAKQVNPNATPQELFHFVNQLGNYTPEMQGQVERSLKRIGIAPFFTAGSTMIRNGINAWTGAGPVPKKGIEFRIWQQLTGGAAVMLGLWAVVYQAYTGKWPWEDKRAKLLQIPVNERERRSTLGKALWGKGSEVGYLNFGFFNPLIARGGRAMGVPGAFETRRLGGTIGQAEEAGERDILNSFAHPALGPVPRALFVGIGRVEPYLTGFRDMRGRIQPQFYPAVPPRTAPGWKTIGNRALFAAKEVNAFYGSLGEATGLVAPEHEKGIQWVRGLLDLTLPGAVANASSPSKRADILRAQRTGTR